MAPTLVVMTITNARSYPSAMQRYMTGGQLIITAMDRGDFGYDTTRGLLTYISMGSISLQILPSRVHALKNLDVENNVTPFMNINSEDTLLGQRWYFRSVAPQTIVTSTTTSTSFNNAEATSTVTLTVTTCLGKRDEGEATHLLKKRGSEILSTTTQTSWATSIVTFTDIGGTQVLTSTDTVFSCQPTTVATTQPGTIIVSVSTASPTPTPTPSPAVSLSTATPSTQSSISAKTEAGSTVTTIFTVASASPTSASGAVNSFQRAVTGWIFLFWIIIVVMIITF